ncbi:MAG: hypothetical protein QM817_25490 [Archangium sp.]
MGEEKGAEKPEKAEKPGEKPSPEPVVVDPSLTPGDRRLFVAGLASFGVMIGWITGMSATAGTTQALLTSVFTFVGGVLLSFGGFRRRFGNTFLIHLGNLGKALLGFALPLVIANTAAVELRVQREYDWKIKYRKAGLEVPAAAKQDKGGSLYGDQNFDADACEVVRRNYLDDVYKVNREALDLDLRKCFGQDGK